MPSVRCAVHVVHRPRPLTIEQHHVIPVAWQQHQPAPPSPAGPAGPDPAGRGHLWDTRTVPLAPTCHRNTHVWIVRIMRLIRAGTPPDAAATAARPGRPPAEYPVAVLAITRTMQAGIDPAVLAAAGLLGDA